jgi:histone deacetylase 11
LEEALREFHPDILVYNAGTDVLEGDRLGLLSISAQVSKLYELI